MTAAHPRGGGRPERESQEGRGCRCRETPRPRCEDAAQAPGPVRGGTESRRDILSASASWRPRAQTAQPQRAPCGGRRAGGGSCPGAVRGAARELSVELPCRAPTPHGSLNALCCGGRFPPKAELCELEGDAQVTHFLKSTCGEIPRTADFLSEEIGLRSITRLGNLSSGEVLGARLPTCAHLGWL